MLHYDANILVMNCQKLPVFKIINLTYFNKIFIEYGNNKKISLLIAIDFIASIEIAACFYVLKLYDSKFKIYSGYHDSLSLSDRLYHEKSDRLGKFSCAKRISWFQYFKLFSSK